MSDEREKLLHRILDSSVKRVTSFMRDCTQEDAQIMVDYLSTVVCDHEDYTLKNKTNPILTLLSKVAAAHKIVPCRYKLQRIEYDRDDPQAAGGACEVFKADLADDTVCIKALRLAHDDEERLRGHIKELILWSHMSHPNTIPFFGVFYEGKKKKVLRLVSPWMSRGNLSSYLRSTRHPQKYRSHFIVDIVNGLLYLRDLGIVHSDLKGENVLISDYDRALITDFGSSHISTATAGSITVTAISMTYRYAAPEVLMAIGPDAGPKKRPTPACDVWSFGGLCCEVLSCKPPFETAPFPLIVSTVCTDKSHSERPLGSTADDKIDDEQWEFISKKCWAWNAQDRPDCQTILRIIEAAWNMGPDTRPKAKNFSRPSDVRPELSTDIRLDRIDKLLSKIQAKLTPIIPITIPLMRQDKGPSPHHTLHNNIPYVRPGTYLPEILVRENRLVPRALSPEDIKPDDMVIAFMGPSGTAKFTFIDLLIDQQEKRVGETGNWITLVDTPGFDDAYLTELEIQHLIADWLTMMYKQGIRPLGTFYPHPTADRRIRASTMRSPTLLEHICREFTVAITQGDHFGRKDAGAEIVKCSFRILQQANQNASPFPQPSNINLTWSHEPEKTRKGLLKIAYDGSRLLTVLENVAVSQCISLLAEADFSKLDNYSPPTMKTTVYKTRGHHPSLIGWLADKWKSTPDAIKQVVPVKEAFFWSLSTHSIRDDRSIIHIQFTASGRNVVIRPKVYSGNEKIRTKYRGGRLEEFKDIFRHHRHESPFSKVQVWGKDPKKVVCYSSSKE